MYNGFLFAKVRKYMMPVYKKLRIDYCNFTCGKTKPEICNTTIFENFGLYSKCNLFQPWTEVLFFIWFEFQFLKRVYTGAPCLTLPQLYNVILEIM